MNPLTNASILAVGTELTTGQVTNRNAAWLSERLGDLNIPVVLHETVADDRPMIKNALQRCADLSQFVLVTGGLGPTTDDFTREVIAEWLGEPLQFHEDVWQQIRNRLTSLGIPVAESNRQQCYFPKNSQILPNPKGTAAGFTAKIPGDHQKQIWVFPGPPREVSAVWENGAESLFRKLAPSVKPIRLFTWQCLGKSEAELGEITESAIAGSGLQTGYRAHRPYVEIKIWCPEADLETHQPVLNRLEKAIAPWIMTRQGEDLAKTLLSKLQGYEKIKIFDSATFGILGSRFGQVFQDPQFETIKNNLSLMTEWNHPKSPSDWVQSLLNESDGHVTLALSGFTREGQAAIGLKIKGAKILQESIQMPFRRIELLDRMQASSVELALKTWANWI